jgi:thiamine pyrophosphokinase
LNAIIICNGNIKEHSDYKEYFDSSDIIICCDGGAAHLRKFNILPDVLLGDFDSISGDDYNYFKNKAVKIIKFPIKKDVTDAEIAVDFAIDEGCTDITIIGAIGSRLDHSIANIFLLKKMLSKKINGKIIDGKNKITLLKDRTIIKKENGYKLSLIPLTQSVTGVTTEGLAYPLNDATIKMGSTWGISNEFIADKATVTLKSGILIAILSKD